MLTVDAALREIDDRLGDVPRAAHSRFVGFAMGRIAEALDTDALVWQLAGLCHDLDFEVTAGNPSRHGIVAAEWLADDLPEEALLAIRAHDHRTGIGCDTPICRALRMIDALAAVREELGDETPLLLADATRFRALFADRPWVPNLVLDNAARLGLPLEFLGEIAVATDASE